MAESGTRNLAAESGTDLDALMDAIVDRYFQIDCAIFTPNEERMEHVGRMAREYKADGVILFTD